ncbi:MAG: MiaB/RimO family radical SAM methylthiotransferase [Armatimonadota bacterium]
MKYHIITFGCQMNEADSDLMDTVLGRSGWQACESADEADLIVLNTCSVRERPEQKAFSLLGELRPWKAADPKRVLAVAGCMAQRAARDILRRAPHVDIVLGTRAFHRIEELVSRARSGERPLIALEMEADAPPHDSSCRLLAPSPSGSVALAKEAQPLAPAVPGRSPDPRPEARDPTLRAFVPIIRGCSNFCSYCIVPHVRGPEASRPPDEIRREVESLVAAGTREVTLLGQNVLAYGRDLTPSPSFERAQGGEGPTPSPNLERGQGGEDFPHLLRDLNTIPGLWRIRFTTCHPRDVTPELISAIADLEKVCEHIHLPIQAGANRLLEEMNRGYTTERYLGIVDALRSHVPGIAITTDMLVGFPGETEAEFEQSLALYQQIRFDAAFMFAFSPRPGTKAATMDNQVPRKVRIERLTRVIEMQNRITVEINTGAIGEEAEVLVDGPAPHGEGLLAGRARNHKQVVFPGDPSLRGSLVTVRLTQAHLWGFTGQLTH